MRIAIRLPVNRRRSGSFLGQIPFVITTRMMHASAIESVLFRRAFIPQVILKRSVEDR